MSESLSEVRRVMAILDERSALLRVKRWADADALLRETTDPVLSLALMRLCLPVRSMLPAWDEKNVGTMAANLVKYQSVIQRREDRC